MADPVLGIGPNLNAYRAALQKPSASAQMAHVARDVARTLNIAFHNVPLPADAPKTRRERDILRLREAIEQMVLALSTAVRDGGLDGVEWPESGGQNFTLPPDKTPAERERDRVELSVRSRQLLSQDPEQLEAMERSLHPLEDAEAASEVAWLAQAQVLHQAILALNAQANIDPTLVNQVLELRDQRVIQAALERREPRQDTADAKKSVPRVRPRVYREKERRPHDRERDDHGQAQLGDC